MRQRGLRRPCHCAGAWGDPDQTLAVVGADVHADVAGAFARFRDTPQAVRVVSRPNTWLRLTRSSLSLALCSMPLPGLPPGAFTRMPDQLQGFLRGQTPVNVRDVEAAFRERYIRETLAALSAPVAIAYGTSSPAVSELIAKRLAATVKHGEAVPLDGADHGMLATHAPQLAELIRSTVARV